MFFETQCSLWSIKVINSGVRNLSLRN